MFSTRLERRRKFNRLAVLVAATLLAVGITLIAVWAVRAFDMLEVADHNRGAHRIGRSFRPVPYRLRRSPGCRPLHIALTEGAAFWRCGNPPC